MLSPKGIPPSTVVMLLVLAVGCQITKAGTANETGLTLTPQVTVASKEEASVSTVPTLDKEEVYRLVEGLVRPDAGCLLPCWWGIIPGESTAAVTQAILAPLGVAGFFVEPSVGGAGGIEIVSSRDDIEIPINLRYLLSPDGAVVQSISVHTQAVRILEDGALEPAYGNAAYNALLSPYSLSDILSTYGPPSQVLLSVELNEAEPTAPDFARSWLLYPERGAILRFTGSAESAEDVVRTCPSNTFVDLWLGPSDRPDLFEQTMRELTDDGWRDMTPTSPYLKPILAATAVTPHQFYETYKEPTTVCLESPLDIWPPR